MTLEGIDVSKWQRTTPPLTGLAFAFARATYATTADPMYATHVAAFRKASIVVGAYHFGVGFRPVASQVDAFLGVARDADLLALDLERDSTQTMTAAQGREFIARLRQRAPGKTILLYSSRGTWPGDLGQDANWIADYTLAARVARRPLTKLPWAFWQWTSRPWDRDKFNGDLAALRALVGARRSAAPTAEDEDVRVVTVTVEKFPAPRRFTSIGPKLRRFSATAELSPIQGPYSGTVDAAVTIESSGVPHGTGFLRLASGGSAGYYVLAAQVDMEGA